MNNIHIRYEDDVSVVCCNAQCVIMGIIQITITGHNFAAGVTLEGLIIQVMRIM